MASKTRVRFPAAPPITYNEMNMATLSDLNLYKIGDTIQMVGAVYAGEGQAYLCLFPEDHDTKNLPLTHLEMSDDDWKTFLRQTDLLEVEVIERSSDWVLSKAILRKTARQVDNNVSWAVYRRDSYTCRYCGKNDIPLTVDHLIVWEEGGPWIEANLVSSCRKCNKVRGNTPFAEWLRHPFYLQRSKGLKPEARAANETLIGTLDAIPRVKNIKSR